jgi:hypothetical protein
MPSKEPPIQFKDTRLREQVVDRTGDTAAGPVNRRAKLDLATYYGLVDTILRDNPVTTGGARALATVYLRDGTTTSLLTTDSPVVSAAYDDACRRLLALGLTNPLVGRDHDYLAAGFRLREDT